MITKCPYLCGPDVLFHPDCTTKSIPLDYTGVTDGVIKAGTPINAAGRVANDATAIGVLRNDCYKGFHHSGNVIIGGYVNLDKAHENSGLVLSDEAKASMTNILFMDASGVPYPGSHVPKPLTYDYMPEGYPKKDGWSIEWDGNTEGLTYIPTEEDYGLYKISDMVLSDEDLLGAAVEFLDYPGNTVMIAANNIGVVSDDGVYVEAGFSSNSEQGHIYLVIARKDSIYAEGALLPEKGVYAYPDSDKFKLSKENITPISTDFIPKNLNVAFVSRDGTDVPTSCNVTYDELRGWVTNGIPVIAVLNFCNPDNNWAYTGVCILGYIGIGSRSLEFSEKSGTSTLFTYNSDGTFSGAEPK